MYSRLIPLEDLSPSVTISQSGDLKQRSVMYWLPPGGRDNGVWADTWVILADIETGDVTAVLDLLAKADVGGYVAIPSDGQRVRAHSCQHLYVDTQRYHQAEDVLMLFLRCKQPRPDGMGTAADRPTTTNVGQVSRWRASAAVLSRLRMKDAIGRAIWVLIAAALIALALALAYYNGSARFPAVHPGPHHTPAAAP